MRFRERPEYQAWRNSVFETFGRKCILCGHDGNIHAHHVMPVHIYPELVFDPTNGVPLCGNCHAKVSGDELAFSEELKRLQQLLFHGDADLEDDGEVEAEKWRQAAERFPSSIDLVEGWFEVCDDSQALVDFFTRHSKIIPESAFIYCELTTCHAELEQWREVMFAFDAAVRYASKDGTLKDYVDRLASSVYMAICELSMFTKGRELFGHLVRMFPDHAYLHFKYSQLLRKFYEENKDEHLLQECVKEAATSVSLAPEEYAYAANAYFASRLAEDFNATLRYAKQSLSLAATDEDKIDSLLDIADAFINTELYKDARRYLREALKMDDDNVAAITDMAFCFLREDNLKEAFRFARLGLMLDPQNEVCQDTLDFCIKYSK
jgi:tetratricopeptide (TPR) repeat protein